MATNFPTSVDALTNPVSNDSLNSPSHSAQHANANDAIEAIETFLLSGGAGNSGLIKVIPTGATNGTVAANGNVTIGSAVSSVVVTGAFSAAYDSYKIIISGGASSAAHALGLKLGATATGYFSAGNYSTWAGTASQIFVNNGTQFSYGGGSPTTTGLFINIDLISPFTANPTRFSAPYMDSLGAGQNAGYLNNTTSYTDFTITPSTGTLTGGTIKIYGYK